MHYPKILYSWLKTFEYSGSTVDDHIIELTLEGRQLVEKSIVCVNNKLFELRKLKSKK